MILRRMLIANRGEIAERIVRTCERLGIETVLAASEADLESVPARLAGRTVCIGPADPAGSYLNAKAIVAAAVGCGAQAIHPGYGFLSESASLAEACDGAGVIFVGPRVEHLRAVGDKLQARGHAMAAGLPVVPGVEARNSADAQRLAAEIGYPLLVKAVAGGGGRGMKLASDAAQLGPIMELATAEALATFGDPRVYLERYVPHGRHVEVQVLGDGEDAVHLGTRDCSVQRRYQKLVEEAPAPNLRETFRDEMHKAAVNFAKHLKYKSLGTVEMLVDCDRETFNFLEMNARIQVEHPVTEAICGLDLIEEQIAVAEGQRLRIKQEEVTLVGHAIECRINAEEWTKEFRPSPGTITVAQFPVGGGIRVDTHIQAGVRVPPYYDSLLAKLIVHGANRREALERLRRALAQVHIQGVATNLEMHAQLLDDEEFFRGGVTTTFLPRFLQNRTALTGKT